MERDHQIRVLVPWIMKRKGLTRSQAVAFILRFPPEGRRILFRMRGLNKSAGYNNVIALGYETWKQHGVQRPKRGRKRKAAGLRPRVASVATIQKPKPREPIDTLAIG